MEKKIDGFEAELKKLKEVLGNFDNTYTIDLNSTFETLNSKIEEAVDFALKVRGFDKEYIEKHREEFLYVQDVRGGIKFLHKSIPLVFVELVNRGNVMIYNIYIRRKEDQNESNDSVNFEHTST